MRRVEGIEGGRLEIELVAQHDHESAQARHVPTPGAPALRQASEQNFTSSQLRDQRLRHVIGRPQAAQGLLGSDCLLPLKAGGRTRFILARPARRIGQR
jgi:hypothetical protein